jgi:hypothetical protein
MALLFVAMKVVVCLDGPAALVACFQQHSEKRLVPAQPYDEGLASEVQTFTGRIVKSGEGLVLADLEKRTGYAVNEQRKAQGFGNSDVKVTGVLDEAPDVIHVTWIEQA